MESDAAVKILTFKTDCKRVAPAREPLPAGPPSPELGGRPGGSVTPVPHRDARPRHGTRRRRFRDRRSSRRTLPLTAALSRDAAIVNGSLFPGLTESLLPVSPGPGRDGEPSPTNRLGNALRRPFRHLGGQARRRSRGSPAGAARAKGCEAPTLAPSLPEPGAPPPLTPEPEQKQLYSPVRSQPPGSHLKTSPTSRLLIGSDISANGRRPSWPGSRRGNRPRSAPR